jgi:hypothetical protein
MLWHDIADSSLQWDWQRSLDDGATWETFWHIDYRRVALPAPSVGHARPERPRPVPGTGRGQM